MPARILPLGTALGLPEIVDITFSVVAEKSTDGLLLQEMMLELAPAALLYSYAVGDG